MSLTRNWTKLEEEIAPYKDKAMFYISSNNPEDITWFCENYKNVIGFDADRSEKPTPNTQRDSLLELMNLGATDFVFGDDFCYSGMAQWLSGNRIVKNVLKQKRLTGCIKPVSSDLFTFDVANNGGGSCVVNTGYS